MFKFLTSKKGFTMVELMIVLVLLSLGVFALGNLFRTTYRSFNKSEERYIKQEAVKTVATLLRKGSSGVAAAQTADIFKDVAVVPKQPSDTTTAAGGSDSTETTVPVRPDQSYSYLFAKPHLNDEGVLDGYYVCILNKGQLYKDATQLSDVPIYITIRPYKDNQSGKVKFYSGVTVTLAALEDDYDYESNKLPTSDEVYYSVDVAYHFPNMATDENSVTVNHMGSGVLSSANTYGDNGQRTGSIFATNCTKTCSYDHCGKTDGSTCNKSLCACPDEAGVVLRVYCDSIIGTDTTNAQIGVPSMCFIATASYGLDTGEVGLLCNFRDNCLLTNPLGTTFVNAYYKFSPPIAEVISESEFLKGAVRTGLKPLVVIAEYCLNEDIQTECAISFALFMLCGLSSSVILVKKSQRNRRNKAK